MLHYIAMGDAWCRSGLRPRAADLLVSWWDRHPGRPNQSLANFPSIDLRGCQVSFVCRIMRKAKRWRRGSCGRMTQSASGPTVTKSILLCSESSDTVHGEGGVVQPGAIRPRVRCTCGVEHAKREVTYPTEDHVQAGCTYWSTRIHPDKCPRHLLPSRVRWDLPTAI